MEKLYQNIKKFREMKNLTREFVASKIGLSLSGYSKIERGEVDLTISRIVAIARVLQVDIEKLLNFDVSQIFNISNNKLVQGIGAKADTIHFTGDEYKEKYIQLLEDENKRLKEMLKLKK
jgi:transcriptional regulator with XRE-family HTH domain